MIERSQKLKTFTGLLVCHPNPRLIEDYGLDFYVISGIGQKLSKMKHQVIRKDKLEDYQETDSKSWILKLGVGLSYFPLKRLGVHVELSTGITNVQMGLILKTK